MAIHSHDRFDEKLRIISMHLLDLWPMRDLCRA